MARRCSSRRWAESIVSKRAGTRYGAGTSRDWRKIQVNETGAFVITGYIEREMIAVAELKDDMLVREIWLADKDLWRRLDQLLTGPETRSGMVPVRPEAIGADVPSLMEIKRDNERDARYENARLCPGRVYDMF